MSESLFPGMSGMARSTVYRIVNGLVAKGELRVVGKVRGRSREKQLLAITRKGIRRLERDLQQVEVEVHDVRRPAMPLTAFLDFIVLFWYVDPGLIIGFLEKRISSLHAAAEVPAPEQGWQLINYLEATVRHQAKLEILALETALAQLREELKSRKRI